MPDLPDLSTTDDEPDKGTDDADTDSQKTDDADVDQPDKADDDPAKEVEKWKTLARKHEQRAKANAAAAKRVQELEAANLSSEDKVVRDAVDAARAEERAKFGERLVDANVRAAAAGRDGLDVEALLEGLNRSRFVDEDGEPDTDAIAAWLDKIAPKQRRAPADTGQGNRGKGAPRGKQDALLDFLDENFTT